MAFHFDLLLLDIEMPGVTGMELAERLRPFLPDVKIIFVTSHIEYAIDAFELSVSATCRRQSFPAGFRQRWTRRWACWPLEDGRTYTIQTNSRLEKDSLPENSLYRAGGAERPSGDGGRGGQGPQKASSRPWRSWERRNLSLRTEAAS